MMSGWLRAAAGDGDVAVAHMETSMRLNPSSSDRGHQLSGIALARFDQRRFDDAVRLLTEAIQLQPAVSFNLALLTACCGHLQQRQAAEAAIARYRQVSSIDMRERLSLFRNPSHRKLFRDGIDLAEGKPAAP
jgi:adenylate cyclase